jgi:hypothetical protein
MVASGFCTTWMNTLLGLIFGAVGSPYSAPGTLYFGLCTNVDGAGSITGEPASGSYARKSITNDTNLWNSAANGALDNKAAITFVTATGSWGTLTMFFIANHLTNTGSAIIAYGTLDVSKAITSGDTPSFAAGDLDILLTPTT